MSAEARRMTFSQEMEALRRQKGRLKPTEIARLALKAGLNVREAFPGGLARPQEIHVLRRHSQ